MGEPTMWLVFTEVPTELESKFNKWYDEVHIPMLLESEYLDAVTRYKLSPTPDIDEGYPCPGGHPRYVATYSFKDRTSFDAWFSGPELAESQKEMAESGWVIGENFIVRRLELYEATKSWHK